VHALAASHDLGARLAGTENQRNTVRLNQAQGRQCVIEGIPHRVEQGSVQIAEYDGFLHFPPRWRSPRLVLKAWHIESAPELIHYSDAR
jgi:hypothetical protein